MNAIICNTNENNILISTRNVVLCAHNSAYRYKHAGYEAASVWSVVYNVDRYLSRNSELGTRYYIRERVPLSYACRDQRGSRAVADVLRGERGIARPICIPVGDNSRWAWLHQPIGSRDSAGALLLSYYTFSHTLTKFYIH